MMTKEFRDHYDDEGYRAYLASDDPKLLSDFIDWLKLREIKFTFDKADEYPELDTVWTEWIKDETKAVLLKMTWGGA